MQPIASPPSPPHCPSGALPDPSEASLASGDGFTALLAVLIGPPPPLPGSLSAMTAATGTDAAPVAGESAESGQQPAEPPLTTMPDGRPAASQAPATGTTVPAPALPPSADAGGAIAAGDPLPRPLPAAEPSKAAEVAAPPQPAPGPGVAGPGEVALATAATQRLAVAEPQASMPKAGSERSDARARLSPATLSAERGGGADGPAAAGEGPPFAAGYRPVASAAAATLGFGALGRLELQATAADPVETLLPREITAPLSISGERAALALDATAGSAPPSPVRQLALAIDRAVAGEIRQLTVQLSPEALGSIEIALEFDGERRLSVTILAERPETLDLLRGEARQLERLLGRQGIDLANAGLELGLMSQERGQDRPTREGHGQRIAATLAAPSDDGGAAPAASPSLPSSVGGTVRRLNLSI